jgi:hypothetical protein
LRLQGEALQTTLSCVFAVAQSDCLARRPSLFSSVLQVSLYSCWLE